MSTPLPAGSRAIAVSISTFVCVPLLPRTSTWPSAGEPIVAPMSEVTNCHMNFGVNGFVTSSAM